jgi:dTDP-L-rhamnose 4-epimerase
MKFKKVLITGGAGFIGSNLALKLVSLGYTVTVLDNLSPQIHGDNPTVTSPLFISIQNKVTFVHGTVINKEDWKKSISDNDVIIHLAAETGTGQSMYQIHHYVNTNIGGTALLLDLITNNNNHQVKKIIVASSRSIYGEGKYFSTTNGIVFPPERNQKDMENGFFDLKLNETGELLQLCATDENAMIHPSSIYGITKQNQEQMVMLGCKAAGIVGVALRYQNVYGPGQSLSNPYTGILSIFSTQIKNNLPINIFEDGKESRDFIFIDDVVNATIKAIEMDEANDEIFNVGSGVATTVLEVANALVKNYGNEVPINITENYRIGDIRHNYADLTKVKNKLNFAPTVSFAQGIKLFCDWVNLQSVHQSNYEASLNEMKQKGLFK